MDENVKALLSKFPELKLTKAGKVSVSLLCNGQSLIPDSQCFTKEWLFVRDFPLEVRLWSHVEE